MCDAPTRHESKQGTKAIFEDVRWLPIAMTAMADVVWGPGVRPSGDTLTTTALPRAPRILSNHLGQARPLGVIDSTCVMMPALPHCLEIVELHHELVPCLRKPRLDSAREELLPTAYLRNWRCTSIWSTWTAEHSAPLLMAGVMA